MSFETLGHVYGLSYEFGVRKRWTQSLPALVVRVPADSWSRVEEFLESPRIVKRTRSIEYLPEGSVASWEEPQFNFTAQRLFGFDGCAHVVHQEGEVLIRFPLVPEKIMQTALSLHMLLWSIDVLLVSEEEKKGSMGNRQQFFTISTCCKRGGVMGHGVFGYVYPVFRQWLVRAAEKGIDLGRVEAALQNTYCSLRAFKSKKEEKRTVHLLRHDFRAYITDDGRFFFSCPGNACDLAIYPEGSYRDLEFPVEFSCHNLDTALQQLTLLSGLAALSDLARKDMEVH